MDFYPVWPGILGLVIVMGLASTKLFAAADAPPGQQSGRVSTLDGLRGVLALAVVLHHAAIYHDYLAGDGWHVPPSRFYANIGPVGVAMFFMITGYLFWSRAIAVRGRQNWLAFYTNRVFRIAPVYLTAVAGLLVAVFLNAGALHVPASAFLAQLGSWLTLGILPGQDLNGVPETNTLLAGVTWTLHYEWLFYAALPFLSIAARFRPFELVLVAFGLAFCLAGMVLFPGRFGPTETGYAALFLCGMLCASLHRRGWAARVPDGLASAAVLALLAAAVLVSTAYRVSFTVATGTAFYLIASGCTMFGALRSRPALRLGYISYGIFLLQGLALAIVLRPPPARALAIASPLNHWLLAVAAMVLLTGMALGTHVLIERPGMALGRILAGRFQASNKRASPITRTASSHNA